MRSFGELLRDLVHGSADLLRSEIRLARIELTAIASTTARGTASVALGAVLMLLGTLALAVGIVLVGAFAKRGLAQLSPKQLMPDQTLDTLREDKEWLKQQLTSGATSS
jgi:hypothetical protein